ncbi:MULTISPECIES: hypothetical protein [unclassified Streptomyces]|uniref:hypothetical protein n=1 Tax=unclassified Streptomyces TaxID=2593676 RepID=UPI0016609773|nr:MULTISPECIES: hypothetical protein [unclassified Streptomyces]MBD0710745.1 hypothetical protein [Streptomyces sp. CBMA291]MBD0717056.1 hypothetical protein [Streptomyces sp. CBMA370]
MTHARNAAMALLALLLLVAGAWVSWDSAQHVLLAKGREHGTLTVTGCDEKTCGGRYTPEDPASARRTLTIARSVAARSGETIPVVVKPDTNEGVRAGWGGGLHAWLPLGGALLLAAPLIGGGLRLTRTAWSMAGAGGALLVAVFFTL